MGKAQKQATRALDVAASAGIEFTVHKYDHDPNHDSFGLEASEKLGVEPTRVFKTLVIDVGGRLCVGVVPVGAQLDLKAAAGAFGGKSAVMADVPLVERTSGYITGAISPLGQKKQLPTVIDSSAEQLSTIYVSAGRRGLEIELSPQHLATMTRAEFVDIARH